VEEHKRRAGQSPDQRKEKDERMANCEAPPRASRDKRHDRHPSPPNQLRRRLQERGRRAHQGTASRNQGSQGSGHEAKDKAAAAEEALRTLGGDTDKEFTGFHAVLRE